LGKYVFAGDQIWKSIQKGDLLSLQKLKEEGVDLDSRDEKGRTPLMLAIQTGRLPLVEYLLENSPSIHSVDSEDKTALHYAVLSGRMDILERVLNYKPYLEAKENRNLSPIGLCIFTKNFKCVELLHQAGAKLNSFQTFQYYPLLHYAFLNRQESILKYLMEASPNLEMKDAEGLTLIHKIVQSGDVNFLKLLSQYKLNLEIKNSNGESPLVFALEKKLFSIGEILLEMGANPFPENTTGKNALHYFSTSPRGGEMISRLVKKYNRVNEADKEGFTPLGYAVKSNWKDNVTTLLNWQANPNLLQGNGGSILSIAISNLNIEIARKLIEFGADPNVKNTENKSLLQKAFESKRADIFEMLLKNGADPNVKNEFGNPLFLTVIESSSNLFIDAMLKYGVDVNSKSFDDKTSLHYACKTGNFRLAKSLIDLGVKVNQKDSNGETPLFYAIESGNEAIIDLLLKSGADSNIRNSQKETVLFRAIQLNNLRILEFLLKRDVSPNTSDSDGNNLIIDLVSSTKLTESPQDLEKVLRVLSRYGINFSARNRYGITALEKAVMKSNFLLVKILVDSGAGVNEPDKNGNTPLKKAILNYVNSSRNQEENMQIIQYLVKKGASVNLTDRNKRTILSDLIIVSNSENISRVIEMVNFLLNAGARTKILDTKLKNSFDYAKESGNPSLIAILQNYYSKEKDPNLSRDWTNIQFGTSGIDVPLALDSDGNGDHIVLGKFENESRLIRLNGRGKALWQRDFPGATSAGFDSKGNIFILSTVKGKVEGQSSCGTESFVQSLIKLDSDGNDLFEKFYGKEDFCGQVGSGGIMISKAGIYLVLYYGEATEIQFVNWEGKKIWSKSLEERPTYLKLDPEDNLLMFGNKFMILDSKGKWKQGLSFPKPEGTRDIVYSKKGNIFLTGQIEDNPNQGIFVEKREKNGKVIWKKQMSTDTRDIVRYIILDDQENIYLAGETMGEMHGSPKISPENFLDYFIIKLDGEGKRLWTVQLGSDANDYLNFFQLSQQKHPILAGSSSGKVPGGTYQGGEDITIFKLNEDGEPY
jgi:ankyrin repeat protein